MKDTQQDPALKVGTLFIKDVDSIDCALFDPATGITGQSWHVDIQVTGKLDKNGFVYDFSKLKKLLKEILKSTVDHALIIPVLSKHVQFEEDTDREIWRFQAKSSLTQTDAYWEYRCPKGAVYPIRSYNITKDIVERECTKILRHRLPQHIQSVKTTLRKESIDSNASFFHYTHGISDHDGLCQRPFHGHRGLLEVSVDGENRPDLANYLANDILGSNIHIVSSIQAVTDKEYTIGEKPKTNESVKIAFSGTLGKYEATVPANRLFFVSNKTSIEEISQQLANIVSKKVENYKTIEVACYEGIGKGAIATLQPSRCNENTGLKDDCFPQIPITKGSSSHSRKASICNY